MLTLALAGQPNCGKTSLFNAMTGARQKVGNYPGVTVERKEGWITRDGQDWRLIDLPGTYSLSARTPDEEVARDLILGRVADEKAPDGLIAVADATHLERSLGLVLELKALGRPMVLALNMMDLAGSRGLDLDLSVLERELGIPVFPTVAVQNQGIDKMLRKLAERLASSTAAQAEVRVPGASSIHAISARFVEVDRILRLATKKKLGPSVWTDRIDRWILHPVVGPVVLLGVLMLLFQSIFTWAATPQDWIRSVLGWLGTTTAAALGSGAFTSLLTDGVIAGVGSVLVFLPQILILFLFILVLEDSGYMARAAFLMDQWMSKVGLHGRAFIPLLSSYACAIPGIMATRTIESPRDRLATILVAPLTTCSARLPVYSLLVGAFIPARPVIGPLTLQGLVLLALYLGGISAALVVAFILRRTALKGPKPALLLELPTYKLPTLKTLGLGLWERSRAFLHRAGTVILGLSVLLWFLASYPRPPEGAPVSKELPAISYSYAGMLGHALEPWVAPIGFDWRIAVALIPGFAAREVMVGALATVYSIEAGDDADAARQTLGTTLVQNWSLATALSLLVWYVFACQCLSTLAVTRRETNSWRWPAMMLAYMTLLAYGGAWVTFHLARALGGG